MPLEHFDDDPVPRGILLDLGEALRVLSALEDTLVAIEEARLALGSLGIPADALHLITADAG